MEPEFPLWIKLAYTGMLASIVPVYAVHYGWRNFLWFSDIALVCITIALWTGSALLASMMAVGVLVPELLWCVGFLGRLLFGTRITGLADYMFESHRPLFLRAISLFHLALPPTLLWMLARVGYDERALVAQTMLAWIVLPVTYAVLRPQDENINWVRGPGATQTRYSPRTYLAIIMLAAPIVVYLPTHFALKAFFSASSLGAPKSSHVAKARSVCASRHSSNTARAIAVVVPRACISARAST